MGVALVTQTPAKEDKTHVIVVLAGHLFYRKRNFNTPKVVTRQNVSVVKMSGCMYIFKE